MASDTLKQLGRSLGKSKRSVEHVKRRVGERFGVVEKGKDIITEDTPYKIDFVTDRDSSRVSLDLSFFKARVSDAILREGIGTQIIGGGVTTTPIGGTFPPGGGGGGIIIPPPPTPNPIPPPGGGGTPNPPPTANNSDILSQDDFLYRDSSFPGNVYKFKQDMVITTVGFYAEANPVFYISALIASSPAGGIPDPFWDEINRVQGQYNGTGPGWHVANVALSVKAGDTVVFRFTNPTHDPTIYHNLWVNQFFFADYIGANRYQYIDGQITTGTYGQDPDGTHGMQPSYPGKPIPEYSMFLGYAGNPPAGFEQLEEIPTPVTNYLPGDPGYLDSIRQYRTYWGYSPGTLKVWINGLKQIVSPEWQTNVIAGWTIREEMDTHTLTFASDVPALDLNWERIIVSYVIGDG